MIAIRALTLKNFLSVGQVTQTLKLDVDGLTLVLGENYDSNGGITRNGAGKSVILQAISFGLFGKPLTQIKLPNLINNINNKNMLVTIEFSSNGKKYRVERGKKPDIMKFYVNEIEQETIDDETQGENRQTQNEIERILGMSHTMFKHIVALNTFSTPFLMMRVADQRTVIEELLGIMQLSQRAESLKKLINITKDDIRNEDAGIRATLEANDRIQSNINQAKTKFDQWIRTHEANLTLLAEQFVQVETIDFDDELTLFDRLDGFIAQEQLLNASYEAARREINLLNREIEGIEKEINRHVSEAKKGIETQLSRLKSEEQRTNIEIDRIKIRITHAEDAKIKLEHDLTNPSTHICVTCGQDIDGTEHLAAVVANLKSQIIDCENRMELDIKHVTTLEQQIGHLVEEVATLQQQEQDHRAEHESKAKTKEKDLKKLRGKHQATIATLNNIDLDIVALGEKPNSSFSNRDEVYRAKHARERLEHDLEQETVKENPYAVQIDGLEAAIVSINYQQMNDLTLLLKHQDFLLRLLVSKDSFIRKRIIDQNLSYLNSRMNYYLDKLGLPHEVRFLSDLSVEISDLGRDLDFEQLSRGEMNRVIMATSWAFRDVWESMNTSINLLWLDELLDSGLDSQGVEAGLAILKSMARDRGKNIFLISHKEELVGRIDQVLLVKKDNGFTSLELDGMLQ